MLQYCNTPSAIDGLSPAQKLFGHPIQDTLPAHARSFTSEWQHKMQEAESKAVTTQQSFMDYYNRGAHLLPDIQQGTQVVLQNPRTKLWDTYGTVISVDPHRQYKIKTKHGKVIINHRFLRCRVPAPNLPRAEPQVARSRFFTIHRT